LLLGENDVACIGGVVEQRQLFQELLWLSGSVRSDAQCKFSLYGSLRQPYSNLLDPAKCGAKWLAEQCRKGTRSLSMHRRVFRQPRPFADEDRVASASRLWPQIRLPLPKNFRQTDKPQQLDLIHLRNSQEPVVHT
jgi:hypothetical protein